MSGPVYTDEHFAATLLECGPHTKYRGYSNYRSRVCDCFYNMFPDMPIFYPHSSIHHAWSVFWREYIEWVET